MFFSQSFVLNTPNLNVFSPSLVLAVKQTFFINLPSFQAFSILFNSTSITVSPKRFEKSMILDCVLSKANLLLVSVRIPEPRLSSLQSSCLSLFSPSSMKNTQPLGNLYVYQQLLNYQKNFNNRVKLIKKGAEADIYITKWQNSKAILKIRKKKNYRNQILDTNLRKQRTIKESQTISEIKSYGIPVPLVYFVNLEKSSIIMQQIPGKPIHDLPNSRIISLSKQMGNLVGLMHKNGIMHGDLTTSNFIFFKNKVYVIDFGLSQKTIKPEDHAVDLRLIKEILNSAHATIMKPTWKNFLAGYKSVVGPQKYLKIINLVSVIESRGRYATVV